MDRLPINLQGARRGEVLPWPERRRRWSWKEKAQIVAESLAPDAVASAIARRYGLHRNQLYAWRKALRATADDATAKKELWDDIPLILKEIRNNKFAKYCFEIDYKQTYRNGILVPRYY